MIYIIVILGLVLFLVYPSRPSESQIQPFIKKNYAHRGLHSIDKLIPENSLLAFQKAVEDGYGIELDVQLSKDGQVIVFHDNTLMRLTGFEGKASEYTWEQLKTAKLCGTEYGIPLFQEVLQLVEGKVPIIVELKRGSQNKLLCEKTYTILKQYSGVVCVESFDPRIVQWFKKYAPTILRGQLLESYKSYRKDGANPFVAFLLSRGITNCMARPQFIAWGPDEKNMMIKFIELFGTMKVFWTAQPNTDHKALTHQYDAIIFEFYEPKE